MRLLLLTLLAANTAFSAPKPLALIPFELHENLPLITVGRDLTFVLSTATPRTTVDERLGTMTSFDLGGFSVQLDAASADLSGFHVITGRRIDGVFGFDFVTRYVFDLDYASEVIRLYDAPIASAGEKLVIRDGKPYVEALVKIRGHRNEGALYAISTGSGDVVGDERLATATSARVIIEPGPVALARPRSLTIGKIVLRNTNGVAASPRNLGGELLRRFRVIFDAARQRVTFEPNRFIDDDYLFDAGGAELEALSDGTFRIIGIYHPSPAAEVGLRAGDRITGVDGLDAERLTLDRIRRLFLQPGRSYVLDVARDNARFEVALNTRTLL